MYNFQDVCVYHEIQHSNPAEQNASETPDIPSNPNSYPACETIYSKITDGEQEPQLSSGALLPDHVACSVRLDTDSTENLRAPTHCRVELTAAGDDHTYSTIEDNNVLPNLTVMLIMQKQDTCMTEQRVST